MYNAGTHQQPTRVLMPLNLAKPDPPVLVWMKHPPVNKHSYGYGNKKKT